MDDSLVALIIIIKVSLRLSPDKVYSCRFVIKGGLVAGAVLKPFLFFIFTEDLSTIRQEMKVPNEPGLSPNNSQANAVVSDQSRMDASWC